MLWISSSINRRGGKGGQFQLLPLSAPPQAAQNWLFLVREHIRILLARVGRGTTHEIGTPPFYTHGSTFMHVMELWMPLKVQRILKCVILPSQVISSQIGLINPPVASLAGKVFFLGGGGERGFIGSVKTSSYWWYVMDSQWKTMDIISKDDRKEQNLPFLQ